MTGVAAWLAFCTVSCGDKTQTSTEALCAHVVKLGKVDVRDKSEGEIKTACRDQVEQIRSETTASEFSTFAKCVLKTERFVDVRDCLGPIRTRQFEERAKQEEAALNAARESNDQLQKTLDELNDQLDEAQSALDNEDATQEEREQARGRLRELQNKAKTIRDDIRGKGDR